MGLADVILTVSTIAFSEKPARLMRKWRQGKELRMDLAAFFEAGLVNFNFLALWATRRLDARLPF